MIGNPRVFVARLVGLSVFDPLGDEVGRVRDVVLAMSQRLRRTSGPRAIGLVVEVPGRRRVFVPMTRVTTIDAGQVITTGLVNMRRFEQRPGETSVVSELFDRRVRIRVNGELEPAVVEDVALELQPSRDWVVTRVFVRKGAPTRPRPGLRLRRPKGEAVLAPIEQVEGLHLSVGEQGAEALLESLEDRKPADLADAIHDLSPKRRAEVTSAMDDETLADVLEELPDDDRVEILTSLSTERAADVLEVMEPDDATDLLSGLPDDTVEELLQMMQPEEAAPIRRLLTYDDDTAGGMMTPEPVILGPEASIAEALAVVRREELSPAVASLVYVCRSPLETPTGRLIGIVHIQRLLRDPPHQSIGSIVDRDFEPVPADASLETVTRLMANYNMVAVPVTDDEGRLLGAVTVDDVLDHILPEDWREERHDDPSLDEPPGLRDTAQADSDEGAARV
ncbi:magnesium transporter MgtE N-terminal domain-containing protein [Ornithinimicrobium cryptoxanthini]|uniref:CBS domain-containing protein n=1 Tax=Ornithinimicrobium cryptoxanthini TaxID=2934161 RepID=A0ABY4YLI9_9MICO|nr:CBS domain-containing protein [Ornithinimicrobium cryptoxanthini]USQ77120.1 CBS domain-containing protein [Ornithinimicrobium cryptoxanthini]